MKTTLIAAAFVVAGTPLLAEGLTFGGEVDSEYKVDAESIVVGALSQLANQGKISPKVVKKAIEKYELNNVTAADPGNTEGSG
jgi:hypothetical protein